MAGGQNATEQIGEARAEVYAGERVEVDKLPLDIRTEVQALGIRLRQGSGGQVGDLAMVGLPGEFFVEYGLAVKRQSPFARTMTIELANDWIGYVPTDLGLEEGGYETWLARSAKVATGAEELFISTALQCLEQIAD